MAAILFLKIVNLNPKCDSHSLRLGIKALKIFIKENTARGQNNSSKYIKILVFSYTDF